MMRIAAARLPVSLVALLLGVTPVGAQRPPAPPLTSGRPVRLTVARLGLDRHRATVVALDGDTLVVRNDSVRRYALNQLDRLEVSRGRRSRARAGAMYGALAGLGLGILVGVGAKASCYSPDTGICSIWLLAAPPAGALLGLGVGAAVGGAYRSEQWADLPLPAPGTGAGPGRGSGAALRLSGVLRF